MNNIWIWVSYCYLALTLIIFMAHMKYGLKGPTQYIKFAVRVSMFFLSVIFLKKDINQLMIIFAVLFTVFSDFFFVFLGAFSPKFRNRKIYGIFGFIISYVFLIAAFSEKVVISYKAMVIFIPLSVVATFLYFLLGKYAKGIELGAAVILGTILCITIMVMILTFDKWIVLSALMLLVSDIAVAFSLFHPKYKKFILWKENLIWGSYIIGWILIILAV